ncbi:hypothetical protein D9757_007600 [Collybiopsis confluens]|uniref:Aquaporin-like protein n=1 Tax=Collybiopsis confluens TaxID=2823264 RepID=A0A8H5HEY3_9AGAR|nr:hypothetical protein D9757_007600 [Collybiopsis confluens]
MSSVVHLRDVQTRPKIFTVWERHRHTSAHWFVECFAEFVPTSVFMSFLPTNILRLGVGSQISFIAGGILKIDGLGSVLQIGLAYACGILFAVGICGPTSGGHFSTSITATLTLFKGFPPLKALRTTPTLRPRYIVAQILGAYVACLLVYVQWYDIIKECELALDAVGLLETTLFTPQGPAGAFGLYTLPGLSLGRVFLNEFVTDVFLALVIWGSIDPTNILITPQAAPWVIALGYGSAVWGFATPALAANPARDIGGMFTASGGRYAAIAALTAIPATIVGVLIHEIFLADYARGTSTTCILPTKYTNRDPTNPVIPSAQREYMDAHHNHAHVLAAAGSEMSESSSTRKEEIEHSV